MTLDRLTELAAQSEGILYVMAVMLLIALTVIIDRFWYLGRTIRHGKHVTRIVAKLAYLDRKTIADLVEKSPGLPHRAVLEVALQHPELKDAHRLSELLEEAILWQVPRLDSRLWLLDTIVTLAPLLGLLGTIAGMVKAFAVLGDAGSAPAQITGGVGEALIATACGLLIAIVGLVCFNSLHNWTRLIVHQLETLKVSMVNRLDAPRVTTAERRATNPAIHPVAHVGH